MDESFEAALTAEIEAFRAEVREREIRRENQHDAAPHSFFAGIDVSSLDPDQIKALIAQRYEYARLQKRLAAAEQRIAELEAAGGRAR